MMIKIINNKTYKIAYKDYYFMESNSLIGLLKTYRRIKHIDKQYGQPKWCTAMSFKYGHLDYALIKPDDEIVKKYDVKRILEDIYNNH